MVRLLLISILMFFTLTISRPASAQVIVSKELILSSTYGILTGTLVGFASLAFTDQPGENLSMVARGASLGFYLGIALGLYVYYVVPGDDDEQDILQQPGYPEEEGGYYDQDSRIRIQVFPLISQRGVEGLAGQIRLHSF